MIFHRSFSQRLINFSSLIFIAYFSSACGIGRGGALGVDENGNGLFGSGIGNGNGNSGGNGSGNGSGGGSNGNGGANGAGGGANRNRGTLGDITLLFLRSLGIDDNDGDHSFNMPYKFRISGPTQIFTLTCVKYQVQMLNYFGQPTGVPGGEDLPVDLYDDGSGINMGAFYRDADCSQPAAGMAYAPGETTKTVYYKSATARTAVLKADAQLGSWKLYGRYRIGIDNNPKYKLDLGINYEDWTDGDYNDSVVCLKESTLFIDGTDIRSFANQRIQFQIYGNSGCDSSVRLKVIDAQGREIDSASASSTHTNPTVSLNFTLYSRLEIAFYSYGSCSSGRWISQHEDRVRVSNRCRSTTDDEGVRW